MCGIVGIAVHSKPDAACLGSRRRAIELLRHRGPDASGEYEHGQVWLGHTRLSILDLSDAGRQPMLSDDG